MNWLLVAIVCLVSASASAQERVQRFARTIEAPAARGTTLHLDRLPDANSWDVRVTDARSAKTLAVASLPEWAGSEYYEYTVRPITLGAALVVVLEAAPSASAPPDATSFQVAFARRGRQGTWREIATTQSSVLDGGATELVVRDNQPQLIRTTTGPSSFCGSSSAVQVFDTDLLAFRTSLDLSTVAANATPVKATLPAGAFVDDGLPNYFLWFLATSDRRNPDDSRTVIRPIELGDGKLKTAWAEGRPDEGAGQFVTARINPALKLRGFRIFPGNGADATSFAAYARPTSVLISTETTSYRVDLPPSDFDALSAAGGYFVQLPESVRTRCMTLTLLASVDGNATGEDAWKAKATAISEVTPVSELYGLPKDFAAVVVVEKLLKESDTRNTRRLAALTAPLGPELSGILEKVVNDGSDEDRARVAPLLMNIPSEQAVPILMDLFREYTADSSFYLPVRRGLELHRELAGPKLAKLLQESPPSDPRVLVDLVRLVGRLAEPDDLRFLTASLGQGDTLLRKERIRAVSRAGATVIGDLFAVMRSKPNSAAAEDALKAIYSLGRKLYPNAPETTQDAAILEDLALNSRQSRTRMAAVRCLTYFDGPTTTDSLAQILAQDRNPLVRRTAVHALNPRVARQARVAIESALNDDSPDVRIAAAESLASRQDGLVSVPALKAYVANETWPRGLSAGYSVLVQLADNSTQAFLEREMLRDPYDERAVIVADALKRRNPQPVAHRRRTVTQGHANNLSAETPHHRRPWHRGVAGKREHSQGLDHQT
ncbi:MAG: HEAT repeat domain-containing protein [bacterium]